LRIGDPLNRGFGRIDRRDRRDWNCSLAARAPHTTTAAARVPDTSTLAAGTTSTAGTTRTAGTTSTTGAASLVRAQVVATGSKREH
jgi:hypothetical protein